MRVRDWQDIVEDVVESDVEPDDWRAVAGDRRGGIGEDMYLGHPAVGVFQIKTFAKNPFAVEGVGTKVARDIDEEIGTVFPDREAGRFAVTSPPADEEKEDVARRVEEVVKTHAEAPTSGGDLFDDVMAAMDSPAFGPMEYDMYDRPDELESLSDTFEEAEDVLTTELDELVEESDVGRGFH